MLNKSLLFFTLLCALLVKPVMATPIYTEISPDDYITYKNLDWAWASSVNVQFFNNNELYLPTIYDGWRFATDNELDILFNELTLADFERSKGVYISATKYWNSEIFTISTESFNTNQLASYWELGSSLGFTAHFPQNWWYDTFYVRDSVPVPEPNVLLLFAFAILSLIAFRVKMVKN